MSQPLNEAPREEREARARTNELVSDLAGCDRWGCRCWQARQFLRTIQAYCQEELERWDREEAARKAIEERRRSVEVKRGQ